MRGAGPIGVTQSRCIPEVLPLFQHVRPGNYRLKEIWLVECVYILTFLNGFSVFMEVSMHVNLCVTTDKSLHSAGASGRTESLHLTISSFQVKYGGLYNSHMQRSATVSHKRLNSCSFH